VNKTYRRILTLISEGHVRVSDHGYDELAADAIFAKDIIEGAGSAQVIEDYPLYPKGPCVLVLQHDRKKLPIHVVWGIPRNEDRPAVLITAYRPDETIWQKGFNTRRTK
jgi:hypothetical protein